MLRTEYARSVVLLCVYTLLFGWFAFSIAWTVSGNQPFSAQPSAYYHHATEAMLDGRLHLSVVPRAELATLSNPYDSSLNVPYRELDLTYYKGRYYFYWGMAPAVLLFGPARVIFDVYPSEALASATFAVAAMVFLGALFLRVRLDCFPQVGWGATTLILAALGVCSLLPSLPGNSVYNVPIACAAFGQMAGLYCIYRGLQAGARTTLWFLLLGLFASCCIASRPNCVLWLWLFAIPVLLQARRAPPGGAKGVACAAIPPLLTGLVILAVNFARFGEAAEFGMHYQLTGPQQPEVLFSVANILPNILVYGWNLPEATSLYPFLYEPARGPFGIFTFPLCFAAVGLTVLPKSFPLRTTAWIVFACAVGGLLATCSFFGCGMRYMLDFAPATVLAGGFGALALVAHPRCKVWLRWLVVAGVAASLFIGVLLQMPAWTRGQDLPRKVVGVLNLPAFFVQKHTGREYGPMVLKVSLPRGKTGAFEPLLSTGDARLGGEVVFVHYVDESHIQIGFFQTGTAHWVSKPLQVDYAAEQQLVVAMGALLPDPTHPRFATWSDSERTRAVSDVILVLNGTVVYKAALSFSANSRRMLQLAANDIAAGVSQARFTGGLRVERVGFDSLTPVSYAALFSSDERQAQYGAWRVRLRFSETPPVGRYEPLLVSGVTGAADFIYVFYPEKGKVAFGHDCWAVGGTASQTFAADPTVEHIIEIDHSGLHHRSDFNPGKLSPQGFVRIRLNGELAMDSPERTYDAAPDTVVIGENRLGGSTTALLFTGEILSADRIVP